MQRSNRKIVHYKIEQRIRERIAYALEFQLQDPRRDLVNPTVTGVQLSPDLSNCTILYSVLGEEKERNMAARMLDHAKGFLRSELAKTLETRKSPRLSFKFDQSIADAVEMSKKIREVMEE